MATTPTSQETTPRASRDFESVARQYYDAFNKRDTSQNAFMIADDFEVQLIPLGMNFKGKVGPEQILGMWTRTFPDAKVEVLNVICKGDLCAVEYIGRGTQDGPLTLPDGREIAPSHTKGETRFCDVLQLRDGKISRVRSYFDLATILRQAGVKL